MVVKVYISGSSGNKEVKKRQQRVLLILDSRSTKYEVIDIAEPGNEEQKDFMQNNSTSPGATIGDTNPRHPLPPQIFNDDVYCGDYDQFDMANELDEMEKFLKLAPDDSAPVVTSNAEIKLGNGEIAGNEETPKTDLKNGTGDNKPEEADETNQKQETQEADNKEDNTNPENGVKDKVEEKQDEKDEKDEKDDEEEAEGDNEGNEA